MWRYVSMLHMLVIIIFSIVTALFLLTVSRQVFIRKRPLFYPAPLSRFDAICLSFLIVTEKSFIPPPFSVIVPITLVCLLVVLMIWFFLTGGYNIIGASYDSFHTALLSTLNKLDLPFQEKEAVAGQKESSVIQLPSLNTNLHIFINKSSGNIRIAGRKNQHILRTIVRELNTYYQENDVSINYRSAIGVVILGILTNVILFALLFFSFY